MECIRWGIVPTTLCNVTTFISIHFWPRFSIDDRRVKPFFQSLPTHPKDFYWGKYRTLWWPIHVWKWLLMLPDNHVSSCSTLSQLEPDESWHCHPGICPRHQGRKKYWWDNLVIQYIQDLWWVAVPRPTEATPDHNMKLWHFFWPGIVLSEVLIKCTPILD